MPRLPPTVDREDHRPAARPPRPASLPRPPASFLPWKSQRRASAPAREYNREPVRRNPAVAHARLVARRFFPTLTLLYGVKAGLSLVSSAGKGGAFRRILLSKDALRFAITYSAFAALYRAVDNPLERFLVVRDWDLATAKSAAAFVAAAVSAPAISLDSNAERRQDIAIYMAVRAAYFCIRLVLIKWRCRTRHLTKRGPAESCAAMPRGDQSLMLKLEAALEQLISSHGDILALMVILGQVTYAVNLMPHTLPAGYFDVLIRIHRLRDKYGPFTRPYLDLTRERIQELNVRPASDNRIPPGTTSAEFVPRLFRDAAARRGIGSLFPGGVRHDYVACALQHPETAGCAVGALAVAAQVFRGTIRFYAVLYAVTTLIGYLRSVWKVGGGGLLRSPLPQSSDPASPERAGQKRALDCRQTPPPPPPSPLPHVRRHVRSVLRSSIWTALFIFLGRYAICAVRRLRGGKEAESTYALAGAVGALAGILEREGQRTQMILFLFAKGVESTWKCGIEWGWWRGFRHGEIVLHALVMGVIMALFERERKMSNSDDTAMTRTFSNLLRRFVG